MKRASKIRPAGEWDAVPAVDCVVLDAEDRQRRRIVLTGENGTMFLLDFANPVMLHDGDGLVLDDDSIIAVRGAEETLTEVASDRASDLVRFAWHIGNRHAGLQVVGERLRIRRDHVLEDMLREMGATLRSVDAPFDPEPGTHAEPQVHKHGG